MDVSTMTFMLWYMRIQIQYPETDYSATYWCGKHYDGAIKQVFGDSYQNLIF